MRPALLALVATDVCSATTTSPAVLITTDYANTTTNPLLYPYPQIRLQPTKTLTSGDRVLWRLIQRGHLWTSTGGLCHHIMGISSPGGGGMADTTDAAESTNKASEAVAKGWQHRAVCHTYQLPPDTTHDI